MQQVNIRKTENDTELGEIVFIKNKNAKNYIIRFHKGNVRVTIPLFGNYAEAKKILLKHKQNLIRKIQEQKAKPLPEIDEIALKRRAQVVLPNLTAKLAEQHGFVFNRLKIGKSRGRWGSCNSKKTINLSIYLMLLPDYLIEYVLLHELCHTVEMNHSPTFWALLDKCTQNQAKALRKELKKHRIF